LSKVKTVQLSREDWIEAARKVLVSTGIDDVKVDRLAKRMKMTRGSFYWHFKNRDDLLDGLLELWRVHKEKELEQVMERWSKNGAAEIARVWLSEDASYPEFDLAIRSWSRKSANVAKIVKSIDDDWIALLARSFQQQGQDLFESVARARIIYFHQLGYYAMNLRESMEERLTYLPHYNKVLLGEARTPAIDALIAELSQIEPQKK
jgi:AcrR family transcriptional regulator